MAKIRKLYDEAIKPDGSKQVIYPITSTRAVYTTSNVTVDTILNEGYRFGGVVLPTDSPVFTDQRVFYGASVPGVYANFGGISVDGGEAIFLMYDGTSWHKGIFGGAGVNNLSGFKSLASISDLPLEETTLGYLIEDESVPAGLANEFLYVWVGENGDTLDGKYQNCGQLRGASAYEVAVRNGYEGTEQEWLNDPVNGIKGVGIASWEITPEGGSQSDSGVTTIKVTLNTGEIQQFTVQNGKGIVSVAVVGSASTADSAVNTYRVTYSDGQHFDFNVKNGKGITQVVQQSTSSVSGGDNVIRVEYSEGNSTTFVVKNGQQGNTGSSVDYPFELVNNLTTNDATKGLSAAQGKILEDTKVEAVDVLASVEAIPSNYYTKSETNTLLGAKVNTSDIVDALTSSDATKPLSAKQGKALQDAKVNTSDIIDALNSTATNKPLSANQGKVLNDNLSQLGQEVNDLQIDALLLDGGIFNESYSTNADYTHQNKGSVFKVFSGISYEFHISCPTGQYPLYVKLLDLVGGTEIYSTSIGATSTSRVLVYCPQKDTKVCVTFGGAESREVTIAVTNNQVAIQSSLLESKNELSKQMYEKTSVQGVEYELGNISIGNGWTYSDDAKRVRTPNNYTIHLFPGDIIGLSDYTDARFYWGCRDLSGAYTSGGWKTSNYVVVTEGYYVLCISNRTETAQTSARELGEMIQITRNTTLGQLFDKVIKNELKIVGGAYGVHQEFPTIAGKKYIVGIPEQEWSVSNFGANEVAFVVRTKSGSTYTDIEATRIYVRTFGSIRNTYTFEAATGISDIFIRANSGQTITFYVAEEDTPSVIGNYNQIKKLRTEVDNSMVVSLPFGRYLYHHNVESVSPIIPSQSLYDIAYAKALGFKAIEGNIQKCSDGVFVIKHGANGGKLGAGLTFAEGSGLSADTLFSSITSTELRQNVTYASTMVKYCGHIPTLAEFCQECARIGIAPFLRGADESVLAEARKYLPDEQIIIEWGLPRKDFKGLMTKYDGGATSADILAKCKGKGRPFYYCWSSADTASESLFSEVAETLHQNGYVLAATYISQNNFQRLRKIGLDMVVPTAGIIPPFYSGNVLNIVRGNDENLILSDASYNSQDNTIEMDADGTISIVNEKMGAFLSKVCIRLRYSGTLSVSFTGYGSSGNLVSWESDGAETIELAIATYPGNNIVTILANEATTIYDITIFGSVVM